LIALDQLTQRGLAQWLKVRRFGRAQADFERARMSLRNDIGPADAGRRDRTTGQGMSPVIGRATGALPVVRCRSAPCAHAAEHRSYRTKRALHGSENTEAALAARRRKTRGAPESGKQQGKLAPRPNSSTVNQFTSASRELRMRRSGVTSPRRQHWTRRRELLARSDATGARINRSHMRGTQPSR
jgi:hypothetical protein